MPTEPSGSTGVQPSAEARDAAYAALMRPRCREVVVDKRESDKALAAAYAIDTPAIHAAGVAEGREDIVGMLRWLIDDAKRACDGPRHISLWRALQAIEARFPSEGTT